MDETKKHVREIDSQSGTVILDRMALIGWTGRMVSELCRKGVLVRVTVESVAPRFAVMPESDADALIALDQEGRLGGLQRKDGPLEHWATGMGKDEELVVRRIPPRKPPEGVEGSFGVDE